jgi:predicted DNA-binding transcriptional regulator AlpA
MQTIKPEPAQQKDTVPSLRRLLSVREAAEFLGISASWLNKARLCGTAPTATIIGRRVLYDIHDLETWLATRKQRNTSESVGSG